MQGATIASIVTLGVIACGTVAGGVKGLTRQVIELAGLFVSFLIAAIVASWIAALLSGHTPVPHGAALVFGFIAIFIGGLVAFHFVGIAAQRLIHTTFLGWFDRACGAALGLVAATLLVSVLATLAIDLPLSRGLRASLDGSAVVAFVQPIAGWLFDWMVPRERGHIA